MKANDKLVDLSQLAKNVLLNYNIIPESLSLIQNNGLKTLWKVMVDNRYFCLKRLKHSLEKATFTVNAQIHLFSNGRKVPEVYRNNLAEPITVYDEQLFVLYQWVDGQDLNFSNPADLAVALGGLAEFHRSSFGYNPPADAKISSKLGRWPRQYESMRNRMLKWKDVSTTEPTRPAYQMYLKYIDPIIDLANLALEMLNNSSYHLLTDCEFSESSMCHQDYGEGNVISTPDKVYVIDLDGITYDLVIRDLRKIIGKRMEKRGSWDESQIKTILKSYEKYNPLTLQEKEILSIDLLYPHWFFGKVKNLFKKNKPLRGGEIEKIGKLELSKQNILTNLF